MQPNYLATEEDRRCAVEGVKFARRLAATEAMHRMSWPSIGPAPRRRATPTCSISRANSALRSFIRPEPAGWDQGRKPWSMTACASTA
jgi:hypothetical protein